MKNSRNSNFDFPNSFQHFIVTLQEIGSSQKSLQEAERKLVNKDKVGYDYLEFF